MRLNASFLIAICVLGVPSCGRVGGAANFWASYRSEHIVAKESDQGPWGGWRWIHWKADGAGTFEEASIREYAERRGWKFEERREFAAHSLLDWVSADGKPVFPTELSMDLRPIDDQRSERFPRQISADSVVLQWNSGWMRSDPGLGPDTKLVPAPGWIHLSKDGREMAVYHMWGE